MFYHHVIRLLELEKTKEKLPHFPLSLLTFFKENTFLKNLDL